MRFLSCYIAGFGKYADRAMTFGDGVDPIFLKNGEGKTTLAAFLRAMLYGLETAKGKEFCDRLHYLPFAGGPFGGNLVFSHGGKEYRVERSFDKKSETKDEAQLYIDGKETAMPQPSLGESLFRIDAAGFAATLFFSDGGKYDYRSVKRRLLPSAASDQEVDFAAALKALEDQIHDLKSPRGKGMIADEADRIASHEKTCRARAELDVLLQGQYAEAEVLSARKKELENEENLLRSQETVRARLETLERYREDAKEAEKTYNAWQNRFPKGIPDEETLDRLQRIADEINKKSAVSAAAGLSPEKAERLAGLEKRFAEGVPDDETLAQINGKIRRLKELSDAFSREEQTDADAESLRRAFSEKSPDVDGIRNAMERYRAEERKMTGKQPEAAEKRDFIAAASLTAGALLCVAGIVLIAAGKETFGFGMAIVGLAALGFGGFRLLSRRLVRPADTSGLATAEKELYAKLMPFGYYSDNPLLDAQKCLDDHVRFCRLAEREKEKAEKHLSAREECRRLSSEIESFFAVFGTEGEDFEGKMRSLSGMKSAFASLQNEAEEARKCKLLCANEIDLLKKERFALLSSFGISGEMPIEQLRVDCREYSHAKTRFEEASLRAETYRKEENPDGVVLADASRLPAVRQELRVVTEKLQTLLLQIDRNESQMESYADTENDLQRAKERLAGLENRLCHLQTAKDCLVEAESRLNRRFFGPIYDGFAGYLEKIGGLFGFSFTVDQDFAVSFEDGGIKRSAAHLSAGQSVAVALCLRLALADTLFGKERPPMIFDDPFAALDEENFAAVSGILCKLCSDRQILYLTCHASRML